MNDCNNINMHPRDCRLSFDETTHRYFHDGKELTSVTTTVERYFEQFDAEYWSLRKCGNDAVRAKALRDEWEENARTARDLGTRMHRLIEKYYLGDAVTDTDDPTYRLFRQFSQKTSLTPYRTEWRIYHEDFNIAGTLDFLAYDGSHYEIYDWKRSNKIIDPFTGKPVIESRFRKYARKPISHVHDTTFNHYALQVSIYRYILETKYGIEVSAGYLGVFHPDYSCPHVVSVPYLRDEVELLLRHSCGSENNN